jgi:transcriptional regulator with XRE-family HTH domain
VVAKRVAELRKAAGLNQADLAAGISKYGPKWSRSTVVKLEGQRRESLSVTDLFAIALALDVPPVWLLVDPTSADPVPIAVGQESVSLDAWSAILWMVGREPIAPMAPGSRFGQARAALAELQRLAQGLSAIRATEEARAEGAGVREADRPNEDRRLIGALVRPLDLLVTWGYPAPTLPESVRQRAKELDVDLPGTAKD